MFSLRKIIVLILVVLMIPFAVLAEEDESLGTVVINTMNQDGEPISGNWYLHRFSLSGSIVRNGLSGEMFTVDEGTYYLEVRKTTGGDVYEAYELISENPQYVNPGTTRTFSVMYYRTQEDLDAANELEDEIVVEEEVVAEEEVVEEEVVAEEIVEEVAEEPVEEVVPEDIEEPIVGVIIDYVADAADAASDAIDIYVPTFETAPETSDLEVGSVGGGVLEEITELAVTGPGSLLLLIPSALGGLLFISRKRKN
ncbi:hypothetical protein KKA95_00645 [Patescibacteria group bacterium]|nr:hypothetical protein [Patescibacteria group bacterium]